MSGNRVIPFDPENSLLLQKLKSGEMPPSGGVSYADISAIEKWILAGAPDSVSESGPNPKATPSVSAGEDKIIQLPVVNYSIFGSASDADGSITAIQWQKINGPSVTMNGAATLTLTLTNISPGEYEFKLLITDNDGLSNSDSMYLTVNSSTPQPTPTPSANSNAKFSWIAANILTPRCVKCHGSNSAGGYDVRTYAGTMRRVVAGNSSASGLFTAVNSGGMPLNGSKLSADQIQAIKDWINSGAPNN